MGSWRWQEPYRNEVHCRFLHFFKKRRKQYNANMPKNDSFKYETKWTGTCDIVFVSFLCIDLVSFCVRRTTIWKLNTNIISVCNLCICSVLFRYFVKKPSKVRKKDRKNTNKNINQTMNWYLKAYTKNETKYEVAFCCSWFVPFLCFFISQKIVPFSCYPKLGFLISFFRNSCGSQLRFQACLWRNMSGSIYVQKYIEVTSVKMVTLSMIQKHFGMRWYR